MSAEAIEDPLSTLDRPDAAGALALRGVIMPPEGVITLRSARSEVPSRTRSLTATVLKEKFQGVVGPTADERHAQRRQVREQSVRIMFKAFGILDIDEANNAAFGELYAATEARFVRESSDERIALQQRVSDFWDEHPDHPVMQTLDTLRTVTNDIESEDILFMRRTAILLMADHGA